MLFKNITLITILLLFTLALMLGSCSNRKDTSVTDEQINNEYSNKDVSFDTTVKGSSGFYKVQENSSYILYANGQTTEIAVQDKATGKMWYSNPTDRQQDTVAKGENVNLLNSQLLVGYSLNGNLSFLNSYNDSVVNKQYDFFKIDKGIRVNYGIGTKPVEYLIPKLLTVERFNEISARLDESDKAFIDTYYKFVSFKSLGGSDIALFETAFPVIVKHDLYYFADVTKPNNPSASSFIMKKMEKVFSNAGYTKNDLDADNAENEIVVLNTKNPYLQISVEYTIDENGLVVKIPKDSIVYDESFMLVTDIKLLPFFGAANTKKIGYIFVPDGSGALIKLNNGKLDYEPYQKKVYGRDNCIPLDRLTQLDNSQIYLPIFGIKDEDSAFLSIIENGDAVAQINADISGRVNSYNNVYPSFTLISSGKDLKTTLSIIGFPSYQKISLQSSIQVRYLFLDNSQASYTGMALCYQKYLMNNEKIFKQISEPDLPFHLTAIGAVSYNTTFMGIPYKSQKKLTSYLQSKEILQQLMQREVKNIDFEYCAWANGGVENSVFDKIDLIKSLGSKNDFTSMIQFTKENNIDLYPDVDFQYAYGDRYYNFITAKKQAARNIANNIAFSYKYMITALYMDYSTAKTIISPAKYDDITDGFLKQFNGYEVKHVSLSNFGTDLNADYNEIRTIDRQMAITKVSEQMNKIKKQGYKISTDGANVYTLKYISQVNNMPIQSSQNYLFDESIPFYQIVIHGIIPYASEPINMGNDFENDMLKLIETGTIPSFEWIYENNFVLHDTSADYYSVNYNVWIEEAALLYKTLNSVLAEVQNEQIASHSEIANDVYETKYSNGTSVYVNYSKSSVTINGVTIESKSFTVDRQKKV